MLTVDRCLDECARHSSVRLSEEMSLPLIYFGFVCLLLHSTQLPALHIKHSARLNMAVWRMLSGQTTSSHRKPGEERGVDGAFESDMRLTPQQMNDIMHQQYLEEKAALDVPLSRLPAAQRSHRFRRKAVVHTSYLWPSKTVPYALHRNFPEHYREKVLEAMHFWQRHTCIKFVPFSISLVDYLRHADHVLFTRGNGCQSSIGRVGIGQQTTEIADHCNEFGSVAHELGHVLGFYHEQSRPDRDEYVTILRHNIREGRQHNFLKYSASEILTNEPYDIGSVMHYGPAYFSKDGRSLTIDTEDETFRAVMGQRNAPSFIDVKTVNDLYNCSANCKEKLECSNMGYVGPGCSCMCPVGLGGEDCTDVKASTADCGSVLEDLEGLIQSPGFGYSYDNGIDCLWLIQGPDSATSITLTMTVFELEDDTQQPCAFDWLEVRTLGPHLNGQRFCGEGPSEDIVYHGNALVLHFHSDESYSFLGFSLRYTIATDSEGSASTGTATPGDYSGAQYTLSGPSERMEGQAMTDWTAWSPCSLLCDGGTRSRIRTCLWEPYCGEWSTYEEQSCNEQACEGSGTDEEEFYEE